MSGTVWCGTGPQPVRRPYEQLAGSPKEDRRTSSVTAPVVLVVDDDEDTRELYALMLKMSGYRVLQADGGAAALGLAASATFAAVVTDVRMPRSVTALEVCRHYCREGVPVLAVTGLEATAPEVIALSKAGCAETIFKPVSPEGLIGAVGRAIAARGDSEG